MPIEQPKTPSFYEAVKHIPHSNHESDLYLLATDEARTLMNQYKIHGDLFWNQVEHAPYWDIPFAYEPWWAERQKPKS